MAPSLSDINAEVIDEWYQVAGIKEPFQVGVILKLGVLAETSRHKVTGRLHQSGVHAVDQYNLKFGEMTFAIKVFSSGQTWKYYKIEFTAQGGLAKQPLGQLLTKLFESGVLYEDPVGPPVQV